MSWGYHEDAGFGERHGWQGTRDPAAYLAVPKAIEMHATFDLERAERSRTRPSARWRRTGCGRCAASGRRSCGR